jgi:hypothetical protein
LPSGDRHEYDLKDGRMAPARSAVPGPLRARVRQGLTLLVGLGLFLLAVVLVGKFTRQGIRDQSRYGVAFADIDCLPPKGERRGEFLAEVQYLAGMPDRLQVLDPELRSRLADAFGRHPWVERVEQVAVLAPKEVQVRLTYRTPVLAVLSVERPEVQHATGEIPAGSSVPNKGSASGRAVDGQGVLLPVTAKLGGLPVLWKKTLPAGPSGTPWGDAGVEAAARTAALLRPYQSQLQPETFAVTGSELEWLTSSGSRILWGRPPGQELAREAPAATKVERLLQFCKQKGSLGSPGEPFEHDVRPRDRAIHRPLAGPG